MYQTSVHSIPDRSSFKQQVLAWAQQYPTCCYLDNNGYGHYPYQDKEGLVAVGCASQVKGKVGQALAGLSAYLKEHPNRWLFGFLTYDLKNEIENLQSDNFDGINMPALHFFEPTIILQIATDNQLVIQSVSDEPNLIYQQIIDQNVQTPSVPSLQTNQLQQRISKETYLKTIQRIREHIAEGDVYEMNFCQEFFMENTDIPAAATFMKLNHFSPSPFSAYYKSGEKYLLCTSPERFLKKTGRKLVSQPIKGTIKRGRNKQQDKKLVQALRQSEKDRAENVMIVDLVRNDLAKNAVVGSVNVEELFGIYTFPKVHHMISTITSEIEQGTDFPTLFKSTFPMGSMTGAPKVAAMELIEKYEATKRGLYSGAVGYITPEGDFDFNVVIRSLLYNAANRYLSYQAGGAITYDSDPENEYKESLLKAAGVFDLLSG